MTSFHPSDPQCELDRNSSSRANSSAAVDVLPVGFQVGPYCLERLLGSGGMADVYYGVHETLHRPAAIKILRPSLAADETNLQRFMQEARAAASLVHPNIVQVYDVGQDEQHRYIAQEYIPGSNLKQYLTDTIGGRGTDDRTSSTRSTSDFPAANCTPDTAEITAQGTAGLPEADPDGREMDPSSSDGNPLPIEEALSIFLQVLSALTKSASSGIVHRDIKPENIMLTEEGQVKVADFGLARVLLGDDPQLTRAGTTLGTPMYMSPEQIQEGQVDIRSDLYSLGVTLYHMLAGRPPFTGETPLALAMQHVQAVPPDLRSIRPDLPPSLGALIDRLLAKSPADRPASPVEVLEELRQHRHTDLAEYWPEQAVPLPRAGNLAHDGPLQATLVLHSKLRAKRRQWRKRVLTGGGVAALLVACFGIGSFVAFTPPRTILLPGDRDSFTDIPQQESAELQYRLALLSTSDELDPVRKWQAIPALFPPEESEANRLYSGLAWLQLARQLQDDSQLAEALGFLWRITEDSGMPVIVQVLAYLEAARIEQASSNMAAATEHVAQARRLQRQSEVSDNDRELLQVFIKVLPAQVQQLWAEA